MEMRRSGDRSLFAEQFFEIFDKADQNHHGRSRKANEKHRLKEFYCECGENHGTDCKWFPAQGSLKSAETIGKSIPLV
jgi:hypothetical protein